MPKPTAEGISKSVDHGPDSQSALESRTVDVRELVGPEGSSGQPSHAMYYITPSMGTQL